MRTKTLLGAAAVFLTTGLVQTSASAQATLSGFTVQKFEPSERGSEWFGNESLDLRGKFRPAIGVVSDFSYRSLVIYKPSDNVRGSVVRNQFMLHPGASFVLYDRLRLAVSIPIQLGVDGHSASVLRNNTLIEYAPPPDDAGFGDIRLGADVRIAGEYGGPITFAAGAQVWAPTGSQKQYISDGYARLKPRLMVAGDISFFTYAASTGVNIRFRGNEDIEPGAIGHELNVTLAAGVKVLDKKLVVGPEAWGSTQFKHFFGAHETPVEIGGGAHYLIANQIRVGAGAMGGPVRSFSNPAYRLMLGVEWAPGLSGDRDGDGIPDDKDACPDQKGVHSADPNKNGCPETPPPVALMPVMDRDNDGIPDNVDACPDTPGVKTDDPATNGCRDTDGDGIYDPKDACPNEKGPASQDPAINGCPDTDGDGIVDKLDACPKEAGPANSDPAKNGCPVGDRDKDGVKDDVDACPDDPGPADPDPKRNGCPKAFISQGQIKILDQVKFKTNSAALETGRDSLDILEAVKGVLDAHPEVKKVRIEGHTDSTGGAALNKKLSADRAASVKKWLTNHGIPAARLSSQGFGPDKPIDTNDTEAGKRNNRRVEFHIE